MLPDDPGYFSGVVPVGRLGRPAEVADMALTMLRNEYLTSKVISLDSGSIRASRMPTERAD